MKVLRVAIAGARGRMGRALLHIIAETPETILAAAVERPGHPDLGKDAAEGEALAQFGVAISDSVEKAMAGADVWIDFTSPEATVEAAKLAHAKGSSADHKVALVIGTTGLSSEHRSVLEEASKAVPVVCSANMSVGVNVLLDLISRATAALGSDFDPEILELHHRQKRDAPSGTALMMAEALAKASGRDLKTDAKHGRSGLVGPRSDKEMGILALRGGDVVGDHTAFFLGQGERLELTHRASSRETFARGAIRAALWLRGKSPGLYTMQHVLGMR